MKPLIDLKNITLRIPNVERAILKDLNLQIFKGDCLIILGSNGSGKSSLMKCVNGLYKPQQGSIFLNGTNISGKSVETIAQSITTLTQDLTVSTFSNMTVFENCICAALKQNKFPDKKSIREYLLHFHPILPEKLDEKVSSLSGGQRQCLALAMCSYTTPQLLLLDEHTSALDPIVGRHMLAITQNQLSKYPDLSVMMTTHNLNDALKFGNRLIALQEGKIIFEANKKEKNKLTKDDLSNLYR